MNREEILDFLKDEPPEVRNGLLRAYEVLAEDKGPSPEDALLIAAKIGKAAAQGAVPSAALLVEGIAALITLGRTLQARKQARVDQSRRIASAAGLAARASSKATSAMMQARGAGKARSKGN